MSTIESQASWRVVKTPHQKYKLNTIPPPPWPTTRSTLDTQRLPIQCAWTTPNSFALRPPLSLEVECLTT